MDSYGVVPIGDHMLSIPGFIFYLVLIAFGMVIVRSLTANIPKRYRALNYMMYLFSIVAIVTWGFLALGLGFYVES